MSSEMRKNVNKMDEDVKAGLWSSASYVLVMLILGIPIWWKTTEVYRVTLPYNDIDDLSLTLGSNLRLKVNLQLVGTDTRKDHQWGPQMQSHLQDSEVYSLLLSSRAPTSEELRLTRESRSLEELDAGLNEIHGNVLTGSVLIFEISSAMANLEKIMEGNSIVVGRHKCVFFNRNADPRNLVNVIREIVLGETSLTKMLASIEQPRHKDRDLAILRKVEASPGYDILFSLLVPQPEQILATWNDIGQVISRHVQPFVDSLQNFSTIRVKSQVLYLTKLNLKPMKKNDKMNLVSQKDLGLAINPVESQLASHVSTLPRLNFVAYVPTMEQSPLHIITGNDDDVLESNAFLIPRWGGVIIYNLEEKSLRAGKLEIDTQKVLGTFLSQLRLLLGLQDYETIEGNNGVKVLEPGSNSINDWERDYLYRLRTLENLVLTKVTLQSLAHLLTQISNIVINDAIGEEVQDAVESCNKAARHIDMGRLTEAFEESKAAYLSAEKAFFDPSLLALLYFPEDQKYAIYIPLFLPVGIPVIMSIKTIVMFLRTGLKPKSD